MSNAIHAREARALCALLDDEATAGRDVWDRFDVGRAVGLDSGQYTRRLMYAEEHGITVDYPALEAALHRRRAEIRALRTPTKTTPEATR